MSTIRCIYTSEPKFPATDQHPDAVRYQVGNLFVDAVGGQPTQAEIDALVSPSQDTRAGLAIDAVDRLQFEIAFDMENRMRAREGLSAVTKSQYRTALINRWKQLNP
jgi:hypothetical protein